ncbi:MAG: hypothetical protein WCT05_04015 [Lentisphaeria bacterium]
MLTMMVSASDSISCELEAAVFYIDHPNGSLKVSLPASYPGMNFAKSQVTSALLATLYDPDGHLVRDFYWYDTENTKQYDFEYEMPSAQTGFWELP